MTQDALNQTVKDLKRAFDEAFEKPAVRETPDTRLLLAVQAGSLDIALSVSEIAIVMRCPRLTTLPSNQPALAGLAGIRGSLVAVYELGSLLGGPPTSVGRGWVAVAGARPTAAFLFDELLRAEVVASTDIRRGATSNRTPSSDQVVEIAGTTRALVHLPDLLSLVTETDSSKE